MGVSATGKTTIGVGIAERLGMTFIEGDSFHPKANIEKMSAGIPLDDDDRRPWLQALAKEIQRSDRAGISTVTACSALRRIYRDWLREGARELFFIHLHTDFEILRERVEKRQHFMPPSLLQSQFDTLELLEAGEAGAMIDDSMTFDEVLEASLAAFG
ncbi:MAG TPA: gluconokinase [Aeromicrobium sp.]|nr:gluconokinase [Aeromicrobium sp.]